MGPATLRIESPRRSPPTRDEERSLLARTREGDSSARDELVLRNLGLVHKLAREYLWSGMPFDDLVSYGTVGLILAIDKFDLDRRTDDGEPLKLSSYAFNAIKGKILRAIDDTGSTIRLPVHVRQAARDARRLGQEPAPGSRVRAVADFAPFEDGPTFVEAAPDHREPAPDDVAIRRDDRNRVEGLLSALPPRSADVVRKRFGIGLDAPMTLDEVGEMLGVSAERVRQVEKEAMARLEREARRRSVKAVATSSGDTPQPALPPPVSSPPTPETSPNGRPKTSKYSGVRVEPARGKYQAIASIDGRTRYLGCFDSEEDAARAWDAAKRAARYPWCGKGTKPTMNFPEPGDDELFAGRPNPSWLAGLESAGETPDPPEVLPRSRYHGVTWNRNAVRWASKITVDGFTMHLGYFDDEAEAARAYDRVRAEYPTSSGRTCHDQLNFPGEAPIPADPEEPAVPAEPICAPVPSPPPVTIVPRPEVRPAMRPAPDKIAEAKAELEACRAILSAIEGLDPEVARRSLAWAARLVDA